MSNITLTSLVFWLNARPERRKCGAHTHTHTKKRTKRIQFTTCTKSIRVVWNDCLSSFRYFTVDLFLVISIFVPHQFTFSLSLSIAPSFSFCSYFFVHSSVRPSFYATFPPHQHFSIKTHTHTHTHFHTHSRSYKKHWVSSRVYDIDDNAIRQYKMRFYFRSPETRKFASFWKGNKFTSQSKIKFQENNIWMVARKRIVYAWCVHLEWRCLNGAEIKWT